ncbi:4-hydroxy-tetrahydrodipicolinate reductase [Candidatus Woesearchaeota archaeon]|nr:MAG: 4-hydroxy-tetrahydrodipicolinate reductase [Candidatus Woesearchaeota archaeon]
MRIGIVGYGKMGQMIASIARDRNIDVVIVDPNHDDADHSLLRDAPSDTFNVAIDFTNPEVIIDNIRFYCDNNINAVIGTTGWYENINEVRELVERSNIGLIWASNFSTGVNLFFRIIENASKLINIFDEYDIAGHEFHHNQKLDSPSGTARSIANILINNIDRKSNAVFDIIDRKIGDDELHFSSTRLGSVPGTHSVFFDSDADTIELKHVARNRMGFASGAVHASVWITGKKGFFGIEDMMNELIKD